MENTNYKNFVLETFVSEPEQNTKLWGFESTTQNLKITTGRWGRKTKQFLFQRTHIGKEHDGYLRKSYSNSYIK